MSKYKVGDIIRSAVNNNTWEILDIVADLYHWLYYSLLTPLTNATGWCKISDLDNAEYIILNRRSGNKLNHLKFLQEVK